MTTGAHPNDRSPAGVAAWSALEAMGTHLERLHPTNWLAIADAELVPMTNNLACSGDALVQRIAASEDKGIGSTELDMVLVGWAYCVEAINTCRTGRPVDAWPLVVKAERLNGLLMGFAQGVAGNSPSMSPPLSASHRAGLMEAMHQAGKTDAEIGALFKLTGQRVGQIRRKKAEGKKP